MGIAALILGIISIIVGFVPLCGAIAYFPAIVGLVLGIVDIVLKSKKNESKGMGIAGTVLSAIALVIITLWIFVFGVAISSDEFQNELENQIRQQQENNWELE